MAVRSSRDIFFSGPGSYQGKVPFESYPTTYGNKKLNSFGTPQGMNIPDIVTGNRPPSLEQQSKIAQGKISGKVVKPKVSSADYEINAPGMNGYTSVNNVTDAFGPPEVSTQSSQGSQNNQANQLVLSPTGQYQQILVKLPREIKSVAQTKTTGNKPKKKKRPSYGDSEYLSEIKALDRELADYRAKMGLNRTRAGTQHKLSERDLGQQKDRDLEDLKNDFAARGIVLSGVYGDKLGEYNTLFGQQASELDRQYKDALTDIQNQYKDYLREVGVQKEQARLAAIRRRAQKLGKL